MNFLRHSTGLAAALALFLSVTAWTPSHGAVIITATESAGNVVFSYSGSINLTGLTYSTNILTASDIYPSVGIFSSTGSGGLLDIYSPTITGLPSDAFGTGDNTSATSSSGDALVFSPTQLRVASGYVSNNALSGSMTFNSTNLATLGVTPGSYVYTITENSDTITMNVVAAPEPSRVLLAGLGMTGLLLRRRRVATV